MARQMPIRDYSLLGPDARRAVETGLAACKWYHSDIKRHEMKELMQRRDGPAIRDTLLWFALLTATATGGVLLWGTLWCLPFFVVYGILYGSAGDSRWHECGHRTAFKTPWMNRVVYQIASFMMIRNPTTWRWSHSRHHTDTIVVGRDPEIAVMRPANLVRIALNFLGLADTWTGLATMFKNASGRLGAEEATFIPEPEQYKVIRTARIWCLIYAATVAACFALNSILPLMLIGLPRLYGAWHHIMTGLLQHGGLADNVSDHRLNTRTVLMNPLSRFIYWNMNYHVEHHMFPMVPYHALPKLHALIKDDLPEPSPSILAAYREMLPVLSRQLRGEDHVLVRDLPATARPYRAALHDLNPPQKAASAQ